MSYIENLDDRISSLKKESDELLKEMEKNPKMPAERFNKLRARLTLVRGKMIGEIRLIDIQTKKL